MKKFILISGVLFYFFSGTITVLATFVFSDAGKPEHAFIRNYHTGEIVWQPNFKALDVYWETRYEGITNPSHNTDAILPDGKETKDLESQRTYGAYYATLMGDENGKGPVPSGGNAAYTEAVCWHCHSQFVRPLGYENYRWGPTSQIGEGAHENPTRFGTRRIGPDLTREGYARSDDWHYAHFDNPRYTVPQSIMAPYGGISRYWKQVSRSKLDAIQADVTREIVTQQNNDSRDEDTRQIEDFSRMVGFMDDNKEQGSDVWVLWKGRVGGGRKSLPIVRVVKKPDERVRNLTTYVQTRGAGIGITGETNKDFIDQNHMSQWPKANDKDWQVRSRKLDFSPGFWRIQAPSARPTSHPNYVMAPAEFIAKEPAGYTAGDESGPEDYRFTAVRNEYELSIRRGITLFMKKCAGCHGGLDDAGDAMPFNLQDRSTMKLIGNGYGPAADYLTPEPRNFHLAAWPAFPLSEDDTPMVTKDANPKMPRETGSEVTQYKNRTGKIESPLARPEDLFHTIRNGMAPSSMPAWPMLTDWEIWDIVNFVMFLGDAEPKVDLAVQRYIKATFGADATAEKLTAEQHKQVEAFRKTVYDDPEIKSYYNLTSVREGFGAGPSMPRLLVKPNVTPDKYQSELDRLRPSKVPADQENFAAIFWAQAFQGTGMDLKLDGGVWTSAELINIGRAIFRGGIYTMKDGKENELKKTGTVSIGISTPECKNCHGKTGDSWSSRRGEMLSTVGFPARNYFTGMFKLGASHDGVWRAMLYGMAGTPMNGQTTEAWTALESLSLAEHVLATRDEGIYGIPR